MKMSKRDYQVKVMLNSYEKEQLKKIAQVLDMDQASVFRLLLLRTLASH